LRNRDIDGLLKVNPLLPIKPLRPYMATDWHAARRIEILMATIEFLEARRGAFQELLAGRSVVLASFDLPGIPSVSICLAPSSNKEGELTLSLHVAGFDGHVARAIFSFERLGVNTFAMRIGCVQGNKHAYVVDRSMEKAMYGMRPKALVVFVLQELCRSVAVTDIFGINKARHVFVTKHALSKLLGKNVCTLHMDYDALWQELGGVKQADGWFRLPTTSLRRSHEDMKCNKRSMYKKRYALLDQVAEKIRVALDSRL
jgi:uncharacterized protein